MVVVIQSNVKIKQNKAFRRIGRQQCDCYCKLTSLPLLVDEFLVHLFYLGRFIFKCKFVSLKICFLKQFLIPVKRQLQRIESHFSPLRHRFNMKSRLSFYQETSILRFLTNKLRHRMTSMLPFNRNDWECLRRACIGRNFFPSSWLSPSSSSSLPIISLK